MTWETMLDSINNQLLIQRLINDQLKILSDGQKKINNLWGIKYGSNKT